MPRDDRPSCNAAQVPKPRRELGSSRGLFRQRGVRIAEKLGQAPSDSCVVSSGEFLALGSTRSK